MVLWGDTHVPLRCPGCSAEYCSTAVTQINRFKLTLTRTGALHEQDVELNGSRICGLYAACIL
jgi:hypothetical protein